MAHTYVLFFFTGSVITCAQCNNIINYQTALEVFVSGTTVRMIDNMSITSLKKVVAVMTGMAKRIYDAH